LVSSEKCEVDVGSCAPINLDRNAALGEHRLHYGVSGRENHPVSYVSASQAKTFCEWIGGRLPSEAEFDYAASSRGKYVYPWGDKDDDCSRSAEFKFEVGQLSPTCGNDNSGTSPVCSHLSGNSEQGLCDMAGNVAEWTADNAHPNFCGAPNDGSVWVGGDERHRIVKGGSWRDDNGATTIRIRAPAAQQDSTIGFRCARDP
jgi:formylglycine-generating enzyme required for sulfatase activity